MKALVLFDSNYGNTKAIAEAIARGLGDDVPAVSISDQNIEKLEDMELLVVGSPINGWKPSQRMVEFLGGLKKGQLKSSKAATFDTRVKLFIHGDAAKRISQALEESGAQIITNPQPFYVQGKEGPLVDGEIQKAERWAKLIRSAL